MGICAVAVKSEFLLGIRLRDWVNFYFYCILPGNEKVCNIDLKTLKYALMGVDLLFVYQYFVVVVYPFAV